MNPDRSSRGAPSSSQQLPRGSCRRRDGSRPRDEWRASDNDALREMAAHVVRSWAGPGPARDT